VIISKAYEDLMLVPISVTKGEALLNLYQAALNDQEISNNSFELVADSKLDRSKWAAYTIVANALLNLDEFLTKP
jgi:hypothetical protein